jgi:cysteine-rich repeat protein
VDAPPPSPCGNGTVDTREACDDGDREGGDGCSAECQVEAGWDCSWETCVASDCGDGIRAGAEECDDGNRRSGDGCDFRCDREPGFVCVTPGRPCRAAVCGDAAVEAEEECDDGNDEGDDGCSASCQLEMGWACPTPGADCRETMCGDGAVEGSEGCDDGNDEGGDGCSASCQLEMGWACPTPDAACRETTCGDGAVEGTEGCDDGNTEPGDGCGPSCEPEPFYRCGGTDGCEQRAEYVAISEFPAPMAQPQAVHYDPATRSFIAYGFNASQGNVEVCLDGTIVGRDTRTRHTGGRLDGATYDPFEGRFLFVQQSGRLTEVDPNTDSVVRTVSLEGVGTAGGVVVGDDGRLYVSNHFDETIVVFDRFGTSPVQTVAAPTDGPYLDNLFAIPGERLVGYYNLPPGEAERHFSFHALDGELAGRSTIPGVLFRSGRPFPVRADGGEAAPDGGFFLVCSEYLTNDGSDSGICQLFARSCETNLECANLIPGTACKLDAEDPYCYAPAAARDDRYRVDVGSEDNDLLVTANDSVAEAVCTGAEVRITGTTEGDRGGTITVAASGVGLVYTPAEGFCGDYETFEYTANLGGIADTAEVEVLVTCVCGDGNRQTGEECDDGNTEPGDGCDASCRLEATCGDGTVQPGEECDDGNTDPGDGCSPTCTTELL